MSFITKFQVITIFSASNYYEIGSNKGAYLKLDPQLDTHFVQYTAAASKTRKLTFRQKVGLVESSAIRELGARLRERRNELDREFRARDRDSKGRFKSLNIKHISHKLKMDARTTESETRKKNNKNKKKRKSY